MSAQRGDDPQKEVGEHEYQIDKLRTEIGWIGKIIGAADEKAGNIAFLVIASCFVILIIIFASIYWNPPSTQGQEDFAAGISTALISIITLALGYLFGKQQ